MSLALVSCAWLAAFAAAALGLGRPLLSWLDPARRLSWSERGIVAFLLGAAIASFATWGVGSLRYDATAMGGLSALLALLGLPGLALWWRERPVAAPLGRVEAVLLAAAIAAALNLVVNALPPPADFDSLNYHLALPQRDLERGIIRVHPFDFFSFFPALAENLYRLALATVGDRAAQGIHALFGVAAGALAAALAGRLGGDRVVALAAFLLFALIRTVIWEAGTTQVELALTAYAMAALLATRVGAESRDGRLVLLAGLLLGLAVNCKYLGLPLALALGAAMLIDVVARRISPAALLGGAALAFATLVPLFWRNYAAIANPIYPLFHNLFVAGTSAPYAESAGGLGRSERSLLNLLRAPWDIFIFATRYFDGQVFGTPYLLALVPVGVAALRFRLGAWREGLTAALYFVMWYHLLSQQVRFLTPLFPLLAAVAAIGLVALARAAAGRRAIAVLLAVFALVALVNQAMFAGVYARLRFPAALGQQSIESYLAMPTIEGSHHAACGFVRSRLQPGETYVMATDIHSYYCPQQPMLTDWFPDEVSLVGRPGQPRPLDAAAVLAGFERHKVRLVVLSTATEQRNTGTGAVVNLPRASLAGIRLLEVFDPVLAEAKPLFTEPRLAVYDARDLMERLRAAATPPSSVTRQEPAP